MRKPHQTLAGRALCLAHFCQKITYRTGFVRLVEKETLPDGKVIEKPVWKRASSLSPEEILSAFRNSYFPRIAVTVDMIAIGTV